MDLLQYVLFALCKLVVYYCIPAWGILLYVCIMFFEQLGEMLFCLCCAARANHV